MKKTLFLFLLFGILGITFAESFPDFPMTLYGDIKVGTTVLSSWTLKIYNGNNQEIASSPIKSGKYGSNNAIEEHLLLNKFEGSLTFKALSNGKTYILDSLDDSNKGEWCPSKTSITFVSQNCRYDLTFKEETSSTTGGSNGWWWGWGGWWWGGWWGWWGWGGGGWTSNKDTIKTNTGSTTDTSNQQEENSDIPSNPTIVSQDQDFSRFLEWDPSEILSNGYSREMNNAYIFASKNGITTMETIEKADMYGNLTRVALAKMISNYAIEVLKLQPDTSKECKFKDVSEKLDKDYNDGVTKACQLWLMGQDGKGWLNEMFAPYQTVTRDIFGTTLSRTLWGDKYNTTDGNWATPHLQALNKAWIMKDITPTLQEKRGYVMLMLMRSNKQ